MPMAVLRNSLASISAQIEPRFRFRTMNIIASKNRNPNQNIQQKLIPHCQVIPGADSREINHVVEETFGRYTSKALKRNGKGVAIVWFRNDLRVLDNEALLKAWDSSEMVLPVYCVDPRHFQTTYHFGFPKTGGITLLIISFDIIELYIDFINHYAFVMVFIQIYFFLIIIAKRFP